MPSTARCQSASNVFREYVSRFAASVPAARTASWSLDERTTRAPRASVSPPNLHHVREDQDEARDHDREHTRCDPRQPRWTRRARRCAWCRWFFLDCPVWCTACTSAGTRAATAAVPPYSSVQAVGQQRNPRPIAEQAGLVQARAHSDRVVCGSARIGHPAAAGADRVAARDVRRTADVGAAAGRCRAVRRRRSEQRGAGRPASGWSSPRTPRCPCVGRRSRGDR